MLFSAQVLIEMADIIKLPMRVSLFGIFSFFPHYHFISLFNLSELTLAMMFNFSSLSTLFVLLLQLTVNANALVCLPCQARFNSRFTTLDRRSVYRPKITSPRGSDVWMTGSHVTVTWQVIAYLLSDNFELIGFFCRDTRDMPADVTNKQGKVLLGHIDDGSHNEHLDIGEFVA